MDLLMRGAMASTPLLPLCCQNVSPSPLLARFRPLPPAGLRFLRPSALRSTPSPRHQSSSSPSCAGLYCPRPSYRPFFPLRVGEGGEPDADESRFLDEDGVVKDMDGYLNYLSLEYDSIWDTKPSWCQPWTILLTGTLIIGCSWALLHSVVITAVTFCLICAWWFIFLYAYPKAYEDMITQRRQNVVNGVEDTFGVRKKSMIMECRGGTCSGFNSSSKSPFNCILFDLDDTLYSSDVGVARFVRQNIEEFLVKTCGITAEKACSLRSELFRSHGSTLAGLRALGYDIHPDDYHSYVHGRLPYDLIQPDPLLRDLLQSIPHRKIIFTNSDREHARRALARLGLDAGGCYDGIICFETLNPDVSASPVVLKPSPLAFEIALRVAGIDPRRTLFLDDSERNVAAGKALGLRTALVGKTVKSKDADYLVGSIHELRPLIPDIWRAAEAKKAAAAGGAVIGQDKKLQRAGDLDSILSSTTAPVEA